MTSFGFRSWIKRGGRALAFALIICGFASFAAQSDDLPYLKLDAGLSLLQDLDLDVSTRSGSSSGQVEFDPGFRFDAGIGYLMRRGALLAYRSAYANFDLSAEVTAGLIYNQASRVEGAGAGATVGSMDLYQVPVLVNVMFRVPLSERFYFGLGGGAGASVSILDANFAGDGISDQDVAFAWQVRVESGYFITDRISAGIAYKLMGASRTSYSGDADLEMDGTMNHFLGVTVNWLF